MGKIVVSGCVDSVEWKVEDGKSPMGGFSAHTKRPGESWSRAGWAASRGAAAQIARDTAAKIASKIGGAA